MKFTATLLRSHFVTVYVCKGMLSSYAYIYADESAGPTLKSPGYLAQTRPTSGCQLHSIVAYFDSGLPGLECILTPTILLANMPSTVTDYKILAVSTHPPAGRNYHASRSNSLGACVPLSGVSLAFTRCQLLLGCCCCYCWFIIVCQMALP